MSFIINPYRYGAAAASANNFEATAYTGNGSNRTITTNLDLSTDGGLVWIKDRDAAIDHQLIDTVRGATKHLSSNTTGAEATQATGLTSFGTSGFNIGTFSGVNTNTEDYITWCFKQANNFFKVVTYTGNSSSGRTVAHGLGSTPGMVIIKNYGAAATGWAVQHRSVAATQYLLLNSSLAAATSSTYWNDTAFDSTNVTLGNATNVNLTGNTYVMYVFGHDTAGDDTINCGTYVGNGSTSGPTINLGWDPRYILIKRSTGGGGNWFTFDTTRGIVAGSDANLLADSSSTEFSVDNVDLTGTGFQLVTTNTGLNASGSNYVFMAIK